MALSYVYGYTEVVIGNSPAYKSVDTGKIYLPDEILPDIKTTTDLIQENKLLKAQVQAASDRSDFLEDCIAEMATLVYNTEETT